jgi:hypothetical protein
MANNSDLFVRINLIADQFDRSIKESQNQLRSFNKVGGTISKGISASFTKILGAVGLAMGGMDAFNIAIMSTNKSGDAFENTINAAKGSVDAYFRSLITGDWTIFQNGLISAFNGLKELSAAMDDLADKRLSLNYIKSQDAAEIADLLVDARDTTLDLQKRTEALNKAKERTVDLDKNTKEYVKDLQDFLVLTYKNTYGINLNTDDLDRFFREANFGNKKALEDIKNYEDELQRVIKLNTTSKIVNGGVTGVRNIYIVDDQAVEAFKAQNKEIRIQSVLLNESDAKRKQTLDLLQEQYALMRDVSAQQKSINRIEGTLNTQKNKEAVDAKKASEDVFASGSFAAINAEISKLKKTWEASTDEAIRMGAQKAIKDLERQKVLLSVEYELKTTPLNVPGFDKPKGATPSGALGDKITPLQPEAISSNYDYADSLSAIGNVMSSVTNMVEGGAAAWLSWGSNVLSSIATAIPLIEALTTANVAAGASETFKANAKIPVVGWISALAGIAAVVAAMASLPKFAYGGIVPGTSYTGDKVPVMANSGEMILNNGQQANLFRILNDGGSNSRGMGQVEFKINGSDLVGAINNYNRKRSKY